MDDVFKILWQNPWAVAKIAAAYFLFMAVVSGMPKPKPDDSQFWYGWLYTSLHVLSGNLDRASKNPFLQRLLGKGK